MPSPFPGMDPYLEDPRRWPGFHHKFVTFLACELNRVLPPRYVADVDERLYIAADDQEYIPDVDIRRQSSRRSHRGSLQSTSSSVATVEDEPLLLPRDSGEIREGFVEIRLPGDHDHPVTLIEVLSPSNKRVHSRGRELYLRKQQEVLQGETHFMEIDLLRTGEHTVVVGRSRLAAVAAWDFLVCLSRAGKPQCEVWPFGIRRPLPTVRVPLAGRDPDVRFSLQVVLDRCYDESRYRSLLDYRKPPPIPLARADARWAADLLRRRGLRS